MAQNLLPLWRKGNSAMAKIGERVQNSLDEARMLVMGCQILIGVQFEIPFETRFDDLSGSAQALRLIELALLLVALTLILAPAPYHRIVLDGEDSEGLIDGVSRLLCWVLLPLAASLALDVYGSMEGVHGWRIGVTAGAIALVAALVCWYGWELYRRSPARRPRERTM